MQRLVLAHGFTQTARSWAVIERLLVAAIGSIEVCAVDLPGHGDASPPGDLDLWASADHLVAHGGVGTYVGYSMGGRVALHAALAHPDAVRSLVLIGATAGIDNAEERRARRASDDRLAERIEAIGVAAFLDEWLANPLFAGLSEESRGRTDRLRNTATGLAASLRATGTGMQDSLWARLDEIAVPVLLLVGANDAKFTAIAHRLRAGLADATLVVVPDAGHSVHLEAPATTVETMSRWLATLP